MCCFAALVLRAFTKERIQLTIALQIILRPVSCEIITIRTLI